jgi:very-short-patch-repair endonuclease
MDFIPLSRIAATQHGLITLEDITRAGVSRKVIDRLQGQGVLHSMFHRVWRVTGFEPTPTQRLAAAVLAAGSGAAASHRSALPLWQVPGLVVDTLEVIVPRARAPQIAGITVRRSGDLKPGHIRIVDGIKVTSPERTLIDVAGVVPSFVADRALEHWLTRGLMTVDDVDTVMESLARPGRPGVRAARSMLNARALGTGAADSLLEVHTAKLLRAAGLQAVFHHQVRIGDEVVAELDFAFIDEEVYLESDGFGFHTSRRAFDRDRVRQNLLSEHGWLPVRFSDRQLRSRGLAAMETTRRVLAARRVERRLVTPRLAG